jgi:hypothetical protein
VCLLAKVLPSYTLLAAALLIFIQVAKFFNFTGSLRPFGQTL